MNFLRTLHSLSFPFPILQFHPIRTTKTITIPNNNTPCLTLSRRFLPLYRPHSPNLKFMRKSMGEGKLLEAEEFELLMATCISQTLPPALTLEHGLDKINDAVEDLKLNPPPSTAGMYRFQVLVSPGAKALDWFCCQPESSGIFPQFFISNEIENSTSMSLSFDRMRGIYGIGAAVSFNKSYSCALADYISFKRYLSVDSTLMTAYGYMDINSDSSSMIYETCLFHLFIPQFELIELEGISILAATLAWNDAILCTFKEAIQTYELSLRQVS